MFAWSVSVLGSIKHLRHWVQSVWAIATNSYAIGFLQGKIYKGNLKQLCVPGLNCYSCPGAIGSCPIGALQAVIGSKGLKFSYYIVGFLMLIGAVCGRFACGWLCPFGLIQELLHKIPFPKKIKTFKGDKLLRLLKYLVLLIFVIFLPMLLRDIIGQGAPYFCKLICPVGTLEGGIPLVALNESLSGALGWLYTWKLAFLGAALFFSIIIYRPFCKYICPLGAIYSVFNPIAFYRYRIDADKCTSCGACSRACKMNIDVMRSANSLECIRCGKCKTACPTGAICSGVKIIPNTVQAKKQLQDV
ncbi:4Fe-4S binding protein [Acetanaerobacterium elongatum]|uniref:4Fe-4S binding domain-containing protein n=1 Tax=Acetanaerobacterium elongatum TaxID=258515 RepID=A0A1H0FY25_9FIRM|nr:4Fe-4S binding protein [Acetanaerobacterium elongatum]SDN99578.1 4Fe-4S binding domain-containing protein [Acetanaerobacterium elongatum]